MSNRIQMVYQALKEIFSDMNKDVGLVIVEGKRDKEAVQSFGFKGKVTCLHALLESNFQQPLNSSVVILTDFDEEGKRLNKKLEQQLCGSVKIYKRYRKQIGKLLGLIGRKDVESLNNLMHNNLSIEG